MDGEKRQFIAEIQSAIQSGALTSSELKRRLIHAIDKELNKTDSPADIEFVRVGQSLLDEVYGYKIEIDHEASRNALRLKMRASSRKRNFFHVMRRSVFAAAAIFAMIVVADGVFHLQWFEGRSTKDEQQYVVSGHEIDPSLIEKGNADDADAFREIITTDLSEAVSVLGFAPPMPSWFPEGWLVEDYYAYSNDYSKMFKLNLVSDESDKPLTYTLTRFSNMEDAIATFEQNELGKSIFINDWSVYITKNIDRTIAIWYEGNNCFSLYASVSEETVIQILNSIKKE